MKEKGSAPAVAQFSLRIDAGVFLSEENDPVGIRAHQFGGDLPIMAKRITAAGVVGAPRGEERGDDPEILLEGVAGPIQLIGQMGFG